MNHQWRTVPETTDPLADLSESCKRMAKAERVLGEAYANWREAYQDVAFHTGRLLGARDRYRTALERIAAEAPTRLTVGEWTPANVSEIARRALASDPTPQTSDRGSER